MGGNLCVGRVPFTETAWAKPLTNPVWTARPVAATHLVRVLITLGIWALNSMTVNPSFRACLSLRAATRIRRIVSDIAH
jgi:hypothetical protein